VASISRPSWCHQHRACRDIRPPAAQATDGTGEDAKRPSGCSLGWLAPLRLRAGGGGRNARLPIPAQPAVAAPVLLELTPMIRCRGVRDAGRSPPTGGSSIRLPKPSRALSRPNVRTPSEVASSRAVAEVASQPLAAASAAGSEAGMAAWLPAENPVEAALQRCATEGQKLRGTPPAPLCDWAFVPPHCQPGPSGGPPARRDLLAAGRACRHRSGSTDREQGYDLPRVSCQCPVWADGNRLAALRKKRSPMSILRI